MKFYKRYSGLLLLLLAAAITSCKKTAIPKENETSNYDQIYMSAAARNPNAVTLNMANIDYNVTYGASFGGYGSPQNDIQVNFEVNNDAVAAYNKANGTNYPVLPASAYQLRQPSGTISKGTLATSPLSLTVNPSKGMVLFKEYLLAVSIKSATEGVKINKDLQTAYYIVKGSYNLSDFKDYDRTGWSIASVSSEEPNESEANGGMAKHAIDGINTTFWHTRWSGGNDPAPYILTVDMAKILAVHGISFIARQDNRSGRPNTVKVELSANGTDNWKDAGILKLQNINIPQRLFLFDTFEGRFLRISILTNYGNEQFTHLAELGAF